MAVLLDTNILVRLAQPHHAYTEFALRALKALRSRNETLFIMRQNVVEFWAVITHPIAANGLGYTTEQASAEVNTLRRLFVFAPERPVHYVWERLVVDHRIEGKSTHDARLVAAMLVHGIESILTLNTQDFLRYREIRVLDAATAGGS